MEAVAPREELTILGAPDVAPLVASLYEPVASATGGVWRVRAGPDWSAVVKVLRPSVDAGHPLWRAGLAEDHWYYWKREALALRSDVATCAEALRPPVCLGEFERADGSVAVWLEDLSDAEPASEWPVARYEDAARAVGHWQGAYVSSRALPSYGWLSRDWLRSYVERREPLMAEIADAQFLDPACKAAAVTLWANRARLLAFLDGLPRTVCHFDLHPKNMFRAGRDTVLIDWAFVGIGALAEDPATLIGDAVFDFHVKPEDLDDLANVVIDGYLTGLTDAGVVIDRETLGLWIDVAALVRYTWIFAALNEHLAENRSLLNHRPSGEALPYWQGGIAWLARRVERTLHAMGS